MTEEPEVVDIQYEFFTDISNIPPICETLARMDVNFHLLRVLEFWCDNKFDEITAGEQVETIRSLIFQTFIENYSKVPESDLYSLSKVQAAFYISTFDSFTELVPWILTLESKIAILFLLAFARKINEKGPLFSDQLTNLKTYLIESGLLTQIIEFIQAGISTENAYFNVLAAFSTWIDTSFVYGEEFLALMRERVTDPTAYPQILLLAQNTIIHAPEEVQVSLLNEMLPFELLSQSAIDAAETTSTPQVSFANYVFFVYRFFFANEEVRSMLTELTISLLETIPQGGPIFLNVLSEAASMSEYATGAFSIAWQVLVSLANAEDVSIENLKELKSNSENALKVINNAMIADPENTFPLMREIYTNISFEDTGTTLAQIILFYFVAISKDQKRQSLMEDQERILSTFLQITSVSPQDIAADNRAVLILYFLYIISTNLTIQFLSSGEELAKSFYEFITESEASEETLAEFDKLYPKFLSCFGKSYPIPPEGMVKLVQNYSFDRLHSLSKLISMSNEQESCLELVGQIITELDEIEDAPENIISAKLVFISYIISSASENHEGLIEAFLPILEQAQPYLENDEVFGHYINAFSIMTNGNEETNFFINFEELLSNSNGVYSLTEICKQLIYDTREKIADVTEKVNEGYSLFLDKIVWILDQYLFGLIDDGSINSLIQNFELIVKQLCNKKIELVPEFYTTLLEKFIPYLQQFYKNPIIFYSLQEIVNAAVLKSEMGLNEFINYGIWFVFSPEFNHNEKLYYFLEENYMMFIKKLYIKSPEEVIEATNGVLQVTKMQDFNDFFETFVKSNIKNAQVKSYASPFFAELWRRQK